MEPGAPQERYGEWLPGNCRQSVSNFFVTGLQQKVRETIYGMAHPYEKLEGTPIWIAVASAIDDLVQNDELVERTARNYIVGHLSQRILNERQSVISRL
jgi:hypothetical protein